MRERVRHRPTGPAGRLSYGQGSGHEPVGQTGQLGSQNSAYAGTAAAAAASARNNSHFLDIMTS
jgi:hypothetical protein